MIKKALAGLAIAAAAIFIAPAAAQAYLPSGDITGPATIAPGGSGTVNFNGFDPNETVSFTLSGENGAGASLASAVSAVSTANIVKGADSSGSVSVTVTLPSDATGSYTLTGTGLSSGSFGSIVFSAGSSTGGSSSGGTTSGGSTGGLPNTGATIPTLGLWAGGGLLALGAAFVIVLTIVRRQKAANN